MSGREREITPTAAAQALTAGPGRYLVLDCRLPEEFALARIDGSLLIPLHELPERFGEVEGALRARGLDKSAPFAVLCHHGVRSLRATLLLQHLGFAGARSVTGGIEDWARLVDTRIPRYTRDGPRYTRL